VKVGDLIQYNEWLSGANPPCTGIVIRDHSPQRPPHVGRVLDVLWSSGEIEEAHTDDLEIVSESR